MGLGVAEIALLIGHVKEKITIEQLETYGIISVIGFGIVAGINTILMFRNMRKSSGMKRDSEDEL